MMTTDEATTNTSADDKPIAPLTPQLALARLRKQLKVMTVVSGGMVLVSTLLAPAVIMLFSPNKAILLGGASTLLLVASASLLVTIILWALFVARGGKAGLLSLMGLVVTFLATLACLFVLAFEVLRFF